MTEKDDSDGDLDLPVYREAPREHDYSAIRVEEAFSLFDSLRIPAADHEIERMDPAIERFVLDED